MAVLELGVLDFAYSHTEGGQAETKTTYEVAKILEKKYSVMEIFYELRKQKIADYLADSMGNALQDLLSGRKVRSKPMYGAEQKIEASFRAFLDANEMQRLSLALMGAPISAVAMRGISTRRKPNPKGRPAFIDTGTFRTAFRAVIKL